MSKSGMTLQRFAELVASYGADPARWPDNDGGPDNDGRNERRAGIALLSSDARAADIAAEAGALDKLLAGLPAPAPASAALCDRLEAISALPQNHSAPARPANQGGYSIFTALFGGAASPALIPQAAGLLMICLAGGVALGLSDFAVAPEQSMVVDSSAYFFGDPGLDKDMEALD